MNATVSPPSVQFTAAERKRLQKLVDYNQIQSIPDIWAIAAQQFADLTALHDPHAKPAVQISYTQLHQQIQQFAGGLQQLGIQVGDRVCLFADNSPRWFIADQGIMTAGG